MLQFHNDDEYFSTIDDMHPGVLPRCAGYVKPDQVKQARVVMETNEINQELIDKISNNVELIALSCKNSIVAALQKMQGTELEQFDNYLAFWRTGVITLVLVYNKDLVTENSNVIKNWHKGCNYTFVNIPNKVLTFNLDAIDENLKLNTYNWCNLF